MTTMAAVPRTAGMPMMAESPGVWMLTDEELMEVSGGGHMILQIAVRGKLLVAYGLQARLLSREDFADFMVDFSAAVAATLAIPIPTIIGAIVAGSQTGAWLSLTDEEKREVGRWVWDKAVEY